MDALRAIYVHICSWISALSNSYDSKTSLFSMRKKRYNIKNNYNTEYHLTVGYSCDAEIFTINDSNWNKHIIVGVYTALCILNKKVFRNIVFNADWTNAQIYSFGSHYGFLYCANKRDYYE